MKKGSSSKVRFEGESGGTWVLLSEHRKGCIFSLDFENEEV